jgi:hypothetical protein
MLPAAALSKKEADSRMRVGLLYWAVGLRLRTVSKSKHDATAVVIAIFHDLKCFVRNVGFVGP